jgi:predicted permease
MFLYDARHALRQLRQKPGFTTTVVLTLALGIGATTVVYSIVDAVLLRPLPFAQPQRLVSLRSLEKVPGGALRTNDTSYPNFFDWRGQSKSFESLASYKDAGYTLAGTGDRPATRITGVMVSSDFFRTLGVTPILGQGFVRADEQAGNRNAVIGYGLWQSRFSGDQNVVGKTLRLNEENYTVVGVMPRGFIFPLTSSEAELWVTLAHDAEGEGASDSQRGYNQLDVVGRLRNGISPQQASAEMNVIQQGLAALYPDNDSDMPGVELTPLTESLLGDVRRPLNTLFAAVGVLLLIACANAAGLLLTRGSSRSHELAIRSALGASRLRLLRQLLMEAMMLSACGGIVGVGIASAAVKVLPALLPSSLVRAQSIALNGPVLVFAVALSITTGLVFGVLPAWRMSQRAPTVALQENRRTASGGKRQYALHSFIVIGETALGLILLVGAGLLISSFQRILRVNPGFDPTHLLTFRVAVPDARYDDEHRVQLFNQLTAKLRTQPGVEAASAAFPTPLSGGNIRISFSIEGRPVSKGDEPSERVSLVAADFFQTMRIPLLRGRDFASPEHRANAAPVVIVNDSFVKKYFPGVDPIGQHLKSGLGIGQTSPVREVVGVVDNVKRGSLTEEAQPEYYIPIEQAPIAPPTMVVRVSGDPAAYENVARAAMAGLDRGLPIYRLHPYADDLARSTAQQRFQTILLSAFACIALVLAGIGLYALLSYMVVQRTMEIGLRVALGARRNDVLRLILRRGLALAVAGTIVGIVVSAALTRFLQGMLFGVKPLDLSTFAVVSLVLLGVASVACLLPAWKASRIEPLLAMRAQE